MDASSGRSGRSRCCRHRRQSQRAVVDGHRPAEVGPRPVHVDGAEQQHPLGVHRVLQPSGRRPRLVCQRSDLVPRHLALAWRCRADRRDRVAYRWRSRRPFRRGGDAWRGCTRSMGCGDGHVVADADGRCDRDVHRRPTRNLDLAFGSCGTVVAQRSRHRAGDAGVHLPDPNHDSRRHPTERHRPGLRLQDCGHTPGCVDPGQRDLG